MKILSIDRGQHAGGGLQTAEDSGLPGFLHTAHTFSSRGLSTSPWFQEPGLHRWGVTMIAPDPAIASLQRDGRALCWHDDLDRAVASIAQFSRADAGTWRRIASDYAALIRDLIGPEQASPLIAGAERERLLRGHGRTGREYLQLLELSPRQFIETTFEHPSVQAMLLYYCIIREVDVNVTGQGQVIPSYIATRLPGEIVQGGSCALARALKHEIYDHGRHIMEQQPRVASSCGAGAPPASNATTGVRSAPASSWPAASTRNRPSSSSSASRRSGTARKPRRGDSSTRPRARSSGSTWRCAAPPPISPPSRTPRPAPPG